MKPPVRRCAWVSDDPLYREYHDREWGVPDRDPRRLFEKLILDGFQAGLSWITILRKRDRFREVFDGFEPERIARYRPAKIARLLADPGIVRNRQKVEATVGNARAFLRLEKAGVDFGEYLWSFVGGATIRNRFAATGDIPARTPESTAMSKTLMRDGFRFVGPTICYAFMQAVGMVNDHTLDCFRYREVGKPQPIRPPAPGRPAIR